MILKDITIIANIIAIIVLFYTNYKSNRLNRVYAKFYKDTLHSNDLMLIEYFNDSKNKAVEIHDYEHAVKCQTIINKLKQNIESYGMDKSNG